MKLEALAAQAEGGWGIDLSFGRSQGEVCHCRFSVGYRAGEHIREECQNAGETGGILSILAWKQLK